MSVVVDVVVSIGAARVRVLGMLVGVCKRGAVLSYLRVRVARRRDLMENILMGGFCCWSDCCDLRGAL